MSLGSVADPPVYCVDLVGGWESAIEQATSVRELMERLDDGTFEFSFNDH